MCLPSQNLDRENQIPHIGKRLHMSLVRLTLEYTFVVWTSYFPCHAPVIESASKTILTFYFKEFSVEPPSFIITTLTSIASNSGYLR